MLHNVPTYYKGILYPSKAEAHYAENLDRLLKQGKIKWWKRQWPFKVEGDKIYTVITDFYVMAEHEEIHEVKSGYYSNEFIYKSKLFLEQYPNLPYYVVEPTATGWSKTPLSEFIKPYLHVHTPTKQYTKTQIFLSKCFYKLVSKIV